MSKRLDLLTGKVIEDKKRKRSPEADVGRAVDAYLRSIGGYVRQINSGGTMRNGKWTSSGQGAGISDRLCWLPGGKFIAVELKASGKKRTVSEQQVAFLVAVITSGHYGCVADSVDCVKLALTQSTEQQLQAVKNLYRLPGPGRRTPGMPAWLE